ncbi:MAG: hypothetical protein GX279_11415 [Clostridiaceae bacterium]|jgi:hypothetical protein|nr:hypothetical protein [Clostridiaceae bacterium]
MSKKNADEGTKSKKIKTKDTIKKGKMSEYILSQFPDGAMTDFIFYEDFDNDTQKEAVIGITRFSPFPPDSALLIVNKDSGGEFGHVWFPLQDETVSSTQGCVFDNAAVADIDGDGVPELVVSRVLSNEHDIDILVFDLADRTPCPVWKSERTFFHGSMEVYDTDGDGISEIVAECGTREGSDVISMDEGCYRVREGHVYKWDGAGFRSGPYEVGMPYVSYNTAVEFLRAIWGRDYKRAYEMVVMPSFLGLAGLDDSRPQAFKSHIERSILPLLARNLDSGKLIPAEPYDTCCRFSGMKDDFTIELIKTDLGVKVSGFAISRRKN